MIEELRLVVNYNEEKLKEVDGDQGSAVGLITIESDDCDVWNPFYDSSLRFDVDPIVEYGEVAIREMIAQFHKL